MACCFKGSLDYWLISISCNFTGFDSVLEILLFVETNLMLLAVSSLSSFSPKPHWGVLCVYGPIYSRGRSSRWTLIRDRSCLVVFGQDACLCSQVFVTLTYSLTRLLAVFLLLKRLIASCNQASHSLTRLLAVLFAETHSLTCLLTVLCLLPSARLPLHGTTHGGGKIV